MGECLVDLAPAAVPLQHLNLGQPASGTPGEERYLLALPGGSPANVAVGLARLGAQAYFAGRLSVFGFGPWLRQHLERNHVDLRFSIEAPEPPTLAVVTLDSQGKATYSFYGPETADWQWAESELPIDGPGTANRGRAASAPELGLAAVHAGSLMTAYQPAASVLAKWLRALRAAGDVLISFDPNVRPALVDDRPTYCALVENMISCAHIVKASSEDIEAMYGGSTGGMAPPSSEIIVPARPRDMQDAAHRWLSLGASLVVITEGANGATAFHRRGWQLRATPPQVVVKDTIGAGDSFTSGLLSYLADAQVLGPGDVAELSEEHLRRALSRAVAASALTCTRAGSDPPTKEELDQFLSQGTGA